MATRADMRFWGPISHIFDFTLKFEETIFGIALSSIVVAALPFVLYYRLRRPLQARNGLLLAAKLVSHVSVSRVESAC